MKEVVKGERVKAIHLHESCVRANNIPKTSG
jgi:hypothetical protein